MNHKMTPVKKPNLYVRPFQTHNSDGHDYTLITNLMH